MEQKDFDALVDKLSQKAYDKINELVNEAEKGNKSALTELKDELGKVSKIDDKHVSEYVKSLQEHTNTLEAQIKELKKSEAKSNASFGDVLVKSVIDNHEAMIKSLKDKRTFELKTVGDMSTSNYTNDVIQPLYIQGITPVAKRRTTLWDLINKVPWATNVVNYVENSGGEGTIGAVAEAGKFNQKDYDFIQRSMTLSKIAAYAKVTQEMVENSQNVVSFIQNELVRDTLLALEHDILKGDGNSNAMKGLQHSDNYTVAAIPDNFTIAAGVTPTEADVLRAIITQQLNAYFSPTAILMHPSDVMKLDLARDANGQYIMPPFSSNGNTLIKGVPIYEHANLTAGTFHVIDGTRINLYIQRGLNIKVWDQNESDPIYDLLTMTASVKAGVLVKNNEKAANIYGTFSTLITAMTASES